MANQQRPAWFRLSSVMRPPAPFPTPAPAPSNNNNNPSAMAPLPSIIRPSIPLRPPPPPTQFQEPASVTNRPRTQVANPSSPTQVQQPIPSPTPAVPQLTSQAVQPSPPRSPAPQPRLPAPQPTSTLARPRSPVPPPAIPVAPPGSIVPQSADTIAPHRSPVPQPAVTIAPPRSPIPQPVATIAPLRSPVPQPPATLVQQKSPIPQPAATIAPPRSPVPQRASNLAPPRSPVYPTSVVSVPTTRSVGSSPTGATRQPEHTQSPNSSPQSPISNSPISNHVSNHSERTPAQSPKVNKPLARSPSPLTLPPAAQLNESVVPQKFEQKSVLVQETIDKPMKINSPHNNHPTAASKPSNKYGINKKFSDGMRIITLAGENKGAVMELSPSRKSIGNPHSLIKSSGITNEHLSSSESGEEGSRNKDKGKRAMANNSQPMNVHLNNNVQGINNSILYNFSCTHNDPGIHLSLNRKANGSHRYRKASE